MPPLSIFKDRAFLISPLEIPVYILELPANSPASLFKEEVLEGEIRNQLKALYPGTPENTVIDYKIYRRGNRSKTQTTAVFVSSLPVHEMYRDLKRPLIPGLALMWAGLRTAGLSAGLSILRTPQWIEIAFFEDTMIRRYASCPAGDDGLPVTLIAPFLTGQAPREIPALLINAASPPDADSGEEPDKKTEKALNQLFNRVLYMDIKDIAIKGTLKNAGVFNDTGDRSLRRRRGGVKALAALNCIVLLLSLRVIAVKTDQELSRLKNYCQEQLQRRKEAERLEGEIAELVSRQTGKTKDKGLDPYGIISQIQACLPGAWIKSLTLQEGNFNFEAEGTDSIGVLQSLQASGYFNGLTLHQASPSKISGEQFTISGRISDYEK